MDPNILLQKIEALEQKVDKQEEILKKIYQIQKISIYSRYAYWVFLILVTFGAFYFLKPVLGTLGNIYGGNGDILNVLDTVPDLNNLKTFTNQLQ